MISNTRDTRALTFAESLASSQSLRRCSCYFTSCSQSEVKLPADRRADAEGTSFVSQSRKTSAEEGDPPDIRTAQASTSITKFTTSVAKVAKLLSRIDTSQKQFAWLHHCKSPPTSIRWTSPLHKQSFWTELRDWRTATTWKDAVVTPVYKKGDRSNPGNYRPISLLSATSKSWRRLSVSNWENKLSDTYRKSIRLS